jgi:hypothetical protein
MALALLPARAVMPSNPKKRGMSISLVLMSIGISLAHFSSRAARPMQKVHSSWVRSFRAPQAATFIQSTS